MTRLPKFMIMMVTDDGPLRLEGTRGYETYSQAAKAVKAQLTTHPGHIVAIVQTVEHFWLGEAPIVSDAPSTKAQRASDAYL